MPIKGKQIIDKTINQQKVLVETSSIVYNDDVNNKEYLFSRLQDRISEMHYSLLNENMPAYNASNGQKATKDAVIEFPYSDVRVFVNGEQVNVGQGTNMDCYFSPDDGVTIRDGGNAEKGDYLYWTSNKYDLDSSDLIDFVYVVGYVYLVKEPNSTVTLVPGYNHVVVEYTGGEGTTMTVTLGNSNITVGNVSGNFVWDIGGSQEHTFNVNNNNESIIVTYDGEDYTVWYDGIGSLLYSIKLNI